MRLRSCLAVAIAMAVELPYAASAALKSKKKKKKRKKKKDNLKQRSSVPLLIKPAKTKWSHRILSLTTHLLISTLPWPLVNCPMNMPLH